jgi:Squalene-hopene cyclase C-terminal domain
MLTRRRFMQAGAAALALLAEKPLWADIRDKLPDGSAAKDMITPACQEAIDAGLAYLGQNQHQDGSFGTGGYEGNVAITSLGALAMMAGGHQPARGKYGKVVSDALEYVLSQEQKNPPGFLNNAKTGAWRQGGHGPMYGHGFGTLFLAEVYGMVQNKEVRERLHDTLKRAVELIINTQNNKGGWRYKPEKNDADISVTICQIMALRAARNAGFAVPKETADKCIKYVKSCQNLGLGDQRGSFRYMDVVAGPNPIAFARTAAGVVALYSAGVYKGAEVEEGLNYLIRWKRGQENGNRSYNVPFRGPDIHYFYGHYYAVQAMWTAGGRYWTEWFPFVREELLTHSQRHAPDGSWHDNICSHYATAMACIVLQVPNNYLPILQK